MVAGRYIVRTQLPALWLAPGVYTVHFKFIGKSVTQKEDRYTSERLMLDVTGQVAGIGRAALAPPANFTITPQVLWSQNQASEQLFEVEV